MKQIILIKNGMSERFLILIFHSKLLDIGKTDEHLQNFAEKM